jgi:hypothetical protein
VSTQQAPVAAPGSRLRRSRDAVKRVEFPLYFLTAFLALYLAAGNILRGAKIPSEDWWAPGTFPFILLLICAVYVPLYALYKALDAHYEQTDKELAAAEAARAELSRDLALICQQVVAEIAESCDSVGVNDLASHVWLCREDGGFERRVRFSLPHVRKASGIVWSKDKGVAGAAWRRNEDIRADLRQLRALAQQMSAARFDKRPAEERFGLTRAELLSTPYTGVCAIRLFSAEDEGELLGFFIVDYTGTGDFDCVANVTERRPVTTLIGGCEKVLSEALVSL